MQAKTGKASKLPGQGHSQGLGWGLESRMDRGPVQGYGPQQQGPAQLYVTPPGSPRLICSSPGSPLVAFGSTWPPSGELCIESAVLRPTPFSAIEIVLTYLS